MATKEAIASDVREAEGAAVRKLLDQRGMAYKAFASANTLGGIFPQMLTGHRPIHIEAAAKIAAGLGVPIDEFSPRLAAVIRSAARHLAEQDVAEAAQSPAGGSAGAIALPLSPHSWPFSVSRERLKVLTPDDIDRIDVTLRAIIETREADARKRSGG